MGVYLLVFNGVASTDDEQLYIALTEGMATGRGYSGLPLLGNDRLQGNNGSVEPAHPILGIPFYRLAELFGLGKAQTLFILPSIYTALTASLITLFTQRQGFAEKTAHFTGFAYGLGTIAFPYARMNFREPLAALLITSAFFLLEFQKSPEISTGRRLFLLGASFLSLGIAALTKVTTSVVLPVYTVTLLAQLPHWKKTPRVRYALSIVALLAFLVLCTVFLVRVLPGESVSRFTPRFADYIRYTLPRLPHDHFWQAFAGLLLSPGKGLFIYSPILLCAFIAPFAGKYKNWMIGFSALGLLTATQALIYNDAWWSITWGTRALLPVLPLVVLAAVPGIERLLQGKNIAARRFGWGLLILSIFTQAGSLFASDPAYVGWVTQVTGRSMDAATQWQISLAPFFRYPWLGWQEKLTDIAWFHLSSIDMPALIFFMVLLVFTLGAGVGLLAGRGKKRWMVLLNIVLLFSLIRVTLGLVRTDTRYYANITPIEAARDAICELAAPEDLILIDSYLHPFWWHYSNFGCSNPHWAGLPYIHREAIQSELFYPRIENTERLIRTWLRKGNVYLISDPQGAVLSYQQELSEQGFLFSAICPSSDIRPFIISSISQSKQPDS
jgi:hypothetical protein